MKFSADALVPDSIRRSFAWKFRVIALLLLLVIAIIGAVTFIQTQDELNQNIESQLESSADAQAANIEAWVDRLQSEATLVAESDAVESGNVERIDAYLTQKVSEDRLDSAVMAIHYLDTSEPIIRASSNKQFVGINPEQRGVPWAQGGFSINGSQPIVTDAFPGPRVNQPVIAVIAPVPTDANRAVVLMINVGSRAERLPAQSEDRFTRVVNEKGTIIMSHQQHEILTQNSDSADEQTVESRAIQRGLDGESGFAERQTANGTVVMGYAPVDGVNWVVTTRTAKENAFAIQQSVSRNIIILLVVSVLGFLVIGLTISRPTAQALDDLSKTASAIAAGDITTTVRDSNRVDELGEVESAFRETKAYVSTVTDQVEALAAQKFDATVLDEEVPGPLGEAISQTRTDLESSITDIETARDEAMEAQRNAEEMATALDQQAKQFRNVMDDVAQGDLTQRLDTDVENDSMRAIAENTNEMLAELEATVASVRAFATDVDESAEDICASAEEIETTSQEIATTTQEIADGAEEQDEYLGEAFGEMNDLSATVEEIAASSREVADQSSRAADLGRDGCEQATIAADQITSTAEVVKTVTEEVGNLSDEMERIGEIVDLIDEIAEQTNMLALNANIEAARAGDGGGEDGFAVVADEIKSLAEETSSRTEEIEKIISTVQSSTDELVTDMREARKEMRDGAEEVDQTRQIFEDVIDLIEEANDGIHAIDDATDQQATASEEIVAMVDEVRDISARTAEDTSDLAAAADEQTVSISSVTDRIDGLADQADQLRALTTDFTVETETTAASTAND